MNALEEKRAKWRDDYHRNRDKILEKKRAAYVHIKDKENARARAYHARNSARSNERNKKWRESNKERERDSKRCWKAANPDRTQRHRLKTKYKISVEQYELMRVAQRDLCAICGKEEVYKVKGKKRALCIDHDHGTGKVRDLLCWRCNSLIGLAGEDADRLASAAKYIKKWNR